MPTIAELAAALHSVETAQALRRCQSVLIYGPPKEGKTWLAATIAKVPSVRSIKWFDADNGSDTIVAMARDGLLTMEQAAKIQLFKSFDTPNHPVSFDTILKAIVVGKPCEICLAHGRVKCPTCISAKLPQQSFDINSLDHRDWVVMDSGTAIANSCMMYLMKGKDSGTKPGWDEYGPQGRMMTDILTVIKAGVPCNFLLVTHHMVFDEKDLDKKVLNDNNVVTKAENIYGGIHPQMGSRNFSMTVAGNFGHVIYCHRKMNKHTAGSSSTYNAELACGSRTGMKIEAGEPDLSLVYDTLGLGSAPVQTETKKP